MKLQKVNPENNSGWHFDFKQLCEIRENVESYSSEDVSLEIVDAVLMIVDSSEDVEKLEQELKIAKELLGDINEIDGFTEGYMKLRRLNAEMLEQIIGLNEYYKHHNGDYTAETKADILIKKAEKSK